MTKNKFWLVMDGMLGLSGDSEIFKYFTFEEALKSAKEKAFLNRKEYTILEATHHFKANVNVVETVLSAPEKPTDTDKREFKVGDVVYAKCVYTKKQIKAEITSFFSERFCCLNILSDDPIHLDNRVYPFDVETITLAEPTIDETSTVEPKREFKVGDRVKITKGTCKKIGDIWEIQEILPQHFKLKQKNMTLIVYLNEIQHA